MHIDGLCVFFVDNTSIVYINSLCKSTAPMGDPHCTKHISWEDTDEQRQMIAQFCSPLYQFS